jgi:hypothetical protein
VVSFILLSYDFLIAFFFAAEIVPVPYYIPLISDNGALFCSVHLFATLLLYL